MGCRPWPLACRCRSDSARLECSRSPASLLACPTRYRDQVPSMTMPSLKHAIATYQSRLDVSRPPAARYASSSSRRLASPPSAASSPPALIVSGFQRPADQHPAQVQQRVADRAHLPVDERRQLRACRGAAARCSDAASPCMMPGSPSGGRLALQPFRQLGDRPAIRANNVVPIAFQQSEELRNLALQKGARPLELRQRAALPLDVAELRQARRVGQADLMPPRRRTHVGARPWCRPG